MFCTKCGRELKEGWKVCPTCGMEVEREPKEREEILGSTDRGNIKIYNLCGKRNLGNRFVFSFEIPTTVEIYQEQVRVVTKAKKDIENTFFKNEVKTISFCWHPMVWASDIFRLVFFSLFLPMTYGGSIFAVLLSVKLMTMRQIQFELTNGRKIRIPIKQKADASNLLKEFNYPIAEIEKNNRKAVSEKKWYFRDRLVILILLALAVVATDIGVESFRDNLEKSRVETKDSTGNIGKKPEKQEQKSLAELDLEDLVGKSEEEVKKTGMEQGDNYLDYGALDGDVQVSCTDGKVDLIMLQGNKSGLPSFHGVRIGMTSKEAESLLKDAYPEKMVDADDEKAFINLETKGYVRYDIENGKITTITYMELSDSDMAELQQQETEEEDVDLGTVTFPVTVINNTGIDIWGLYSSAANVDDWEEDILGDNILYAGDSFLITFTVSIDELVYDWAIVDSEGTMIEFYDLDFSGCSMDGATLILEYDGENGYATLQ